MEDETLEAILMDRIRIGLYGVNGHQIHREALSLHTAEIVAVAAFPDHIAAELGQKVPGLRCHDTLDDLLADEAVQLVSLCSPRRREQASDAVKCLTAGRHVYAEKPCAMTEKDLDRILAAAERSGCQFHEMAGTALEAPYLAMAGIARSGRLGPVVQVLAQKSYPYYEGRPQDEDVDGGLTLQVGVHAFRMIEHVAGTRIAEIAAFETRLGNPAEGNLKMAVSIATRLENGGVASVLANYLNQPGFGKWGNETLRIFGTRGFVEAVDGGARTRLVIGDRDFGALPDAGGSQSFLGLYLESLLGRASMPFSLEEEIHPTRMIIKAKESARKSSAAGERSLCTENTHS